MVALLLLDVTGDLTGRVPGIALDDHPEDAGRICSRRPAQGAGQERLGIAVTAAALGSRGHENDPDACGDGNRSQDSNWD